MDVRRIGRGWAVACEDRHLVAASHQRSGEEVAVPLQATGVRLERVESNAADDGDSERIGGHRRGSTPTTRR
jgi:hypothetical protein